MTVVVPPRIDWIERQLLAGGDLRLAHRFLDVLRARHLRGAHGTWGVALGLPVRAVAGDAIEIGPGLAYDAAGRELLVVAALELRLPSANAEAMVALRSRGDGCVPHAIARIVTAAAPVELGRDVPLALIDLASGAIEQQSRPHVRSLAPPRIVAGTVALGGVAIKGTSLSFSAEIDTSRAGFTVTPAYLVQALGAKTPSGALGPLLAVSTATATRFTLESRYVFRTVAAVTAAASAATTGALPFAVTWIGVEAPFACDATAAPDPECPCLL